MADVAHAPAVQFPLANYFGSLRPSSYSSILQPKRFMLESRLYDMKSLVKLVFVPSAKVAGQRWGGEKPGACC